MDLNAKKSPSELLKEAKPYDDNEPRPDEIKTKEEFDRALATLKKHIDEGRYDM